MAIEVTQNLTQVTISSVGVQGPKGDTGPAGTSIDSSTLVTTSSFNEFTSSYSTDSASFADRINAATNEQDLSYFATTSSLNEYSASQSDVNTNIVNDVTTLFNGQESLNLFTSSYSVDSASFASRIESATNEQDLSNLATTGSNSFIGDQQITGSVYIDITDSDKRIYFSINGDTNTYMGTTMGSLKFTDGAGYIQLDAQNQDGSGNYAYLTLNANNDNTLFFVGDSTPGRVNASINLSTSGSFNISTDNNTATLLLDGVSYDAHLATTSSFNSYTSSTDIRLDSIEDYTSSLKGAIEISGQDVNVLGTLTAQQFNVTYVSSSTLLQSGSTKFGDTSDDRHEFTGSLVVTGSFEVIGAITASVVSSSYIKFDSLPNGTAPSYQEGLIYYDNDMGALTFYNNEPDISLQIGQEVYVRAINKSGDDILNGTPVRVSGSQGDRVKIYKAEAFIHTGSYSDSEAHNHILGLATHDILDDETGYVTINGFVKGVDTDVWNAGDILYVQTGSAGVLTNVAPPFPYDKIQVGIVGRKHASVGEILVLPKEPTHFGNITGLSGSASTEVGDLWVYKSNNAWATSKTLEGDYTITGSLNIEGSGSLNGDNIVASNTIMKIETISSASYAALNPPVSGTLYIII